MLLMFVFLGIFSRHFVNRFIYMQIYNFSLCKEVKDNHLNVVLRQSTQSVMQSPLCVHVQYKNSSFLPQPHLAPKTFSSKHTCRHNVND